ncbi:MAG: hypothetical protein M3Z21_00935, partial [Pseudomonadota bacterium]|nr:hypothetical protein [Pseudomonadota bacterium]
LEPQFAGLRRTVDEAARARLLALLGQLHSHLDAFARILKEDRSGTLLVKARQDAGEVIRELDNFAGFQPQPLGRWLAALAKDSANIVSANQYARLNELWNGLWADEVLPFCRQAIAGRYPLDPDSPRWVTLDDFGEFFGPGGRMDTFFQDRLKEFVDTSQRPWRWYPQQGLEQPAISAEALRQFQRADAVRQAFFADGGKRPAVRFALKPYEASPDVKKVVLSLGSQQIDYSHDNVPPRPLQWPDPGDTGEVSIAFELFGAGLAPRRSMDGPWAWFRLLEQAELRPLGNTQQYRVVFRVNASEVEYELRPSSVFNPFDLLISNELARFSCPGRL